MNSVAWWGPVREPHLDAFRDALRREWEGRGYEFDPSENPDASIVFNFVDTTKPKPFRRRQRSTYVTIVSSLPEAPDDVLRYEYPLMVRGLANLGMLIVPGDACHFVTPERGYYSVPDTGRPRDLGERHRRPHDAAGDVAAGDRQPLRARPGARAVGRRRADRRPARRRPPARRTGSAPGPVPARGAGGREGAARDQADLRHRRPVLRQPVGAQGRHPLLDVGVRRRQVQPARGRQGHPDGQGLRGGHRHDGAVRARPASSPTACRSTASSTG